MKRTRECSPQRRGGERDRADPVFERCVGHRHHQIIGDGAIGLDHNRAALALGRFHGRPELVKRHHERGATLDQLQNLVERLKAAREAKGLSLSDLTRLTGMDRSALSKLETGQRLNPTVETLVRYAEAVGKRLTISLSND